MAKVSFRVRILVIWQEFIEAPHGSRAPRDCAACEKVPLLPQVAAWLAEAVPPEPHLQSVLFVKVVLALMSGQRAAHLQRMRELAEPKRTGSIIDALLADYGLFHLDSGRDGPERIGQVDPAALSRGHPHSG
jgi:hypothetical protein